MNKLLLLGGAILFAAVVALAPARAEEKDKPARPGDATKEATIFRSVDLVGKAVRNNKNESLGVVEDYVIDVKDGRIVYVAVAYGETLGFGGKLFAVPPQAVKLSDDWKTFVMNVNKDDFDKAQGFDANKWPTAPDMHWGATKDDKGRAPVKEDRKDEARKDDRPGSKAEEAHLRRLGSMNGLTVKNPDNETLGSTQGFGIDLDKHRVVYTVLAYGGVAGIGSKYFAIPWEAAELKSFDLKSPGKTLVVHANKSDFEGSNGFDFKKWPNHPDTRFTKDGTRKEPKR
jgi:sporulation protein YlmC with PRC-barrel domain